MNGIPSFLEVLNYVKAKEGLYMQH